MGAVNPTNPSLIDIELSRFRRVEKSPSEMITTENAATLMANTALSREP